LLAKNGKTVWRFVIDVGLGHGIDDAIYDYDWRLISLMSNNKVLVAEANGNAYAVRRACMESQTCSLP
jgi:hypothetical protein